MKNSETPLWAKVVRARWPKSFVDPEAWAAIFDSDIPDWTPDEIIKASNWMQNGDQKWDIDGAERFVVGVRKYRRAIRKQNEAPLADCMFCKFGWLDFWPDLADIDVTDVSLEKLDGEQMHNKPIAVPCQCAAGRKVMLECSPYVGMDQDGMYRLGRVSRQAYEQSATIQRVRKDEKEMKGSLA